MRLLTLILLMTSSFLATGQNTEIQDWQLHHPDVIFIEQDVFSNFTEEQTEQLGDKIVVYQSEISTGDIAFYESSVKTAFLASEDTRIDPDLDEAFSIKKWLAQNPDVKIIKRSFYNSLMQDQREVYTNVNAMILIGEMVTIADINAYGH